MPAITQVPSLASILDSGDQTLFSPPTKTRGPQGQLPFTDEMLRPELQDLGIFVDGMDNICVTHERVAQSYFADGTIALACPPLRALLHIMAHGHWEGKGAEAPEVRALFTRASLLASDWYAERLKAKQAADVALWSRHVDTLTTVCGELDGDTVKQLRLAHRLKGAQAELERVGTADYLDSLRGTLGRQPL